MSVEISLEIIAGIINEKVEDQINVDSGFESYTMEMEEIEHIFEKHPSEKEQVNDKVQVTSVASEDETKIYTVISNLNENSSENKVFVIQDITNGDVISLQLL